MPTVAYTDRQNRQPLWINRPKAGFQWAANFLVVEHTPPLMGETHDISSTSTCETRLALEICFRHTSYGYYIAEQAIVAAAAIICSSWFLHCGGLAQLSEVG